MVTGSSNVIALEKANIEKVCDTATPFPISEIAPDIESPSSKIATDIENPSQF